jgi:RimJ/RimL family protein N-acetyltransferase
MEDRGSKPLNYPPECEEEFTLATGQRVAIRPILPEDAQRLQVSFRKLSPQTIFLRFLETFKELSDKQAHHFANLDYQTHMAFVALIHAAGAEQIIGVARYAILKDQPGHVEAAIVVRDDFQNLGLGAILMDRLARYAIKQGLKAFVATAHTSNARIRRFIQRSGLPYQRSMVEPGVWEIKVFLEVEGGTN